VAQPALWSIVTKHNMHLCRQPAQGVAACCDASGACTKRFPRDFNADTALGDDEYAQYRRRNNGRTFEKFYRGQLHYLDNRHVVPYNPSLSLRYNAHINVEICSSIKAVKYVVKYVNKGPDRAAVTLNHGGQHDAPVDELQRLKGRWTYELVTRLLGELMFTGSPRELADARTRRKTPADSTVSKTEQRKTKNVHNMRTDKRLRAFE
jgi:hypothetical protein